MSIPDDTPDLNPSGFDPEFSNSPWALARVYRDLGWQVVPAYSPGETKGTYKRPMVEWAKLQDALVPDFTFERWYGTGGEHRDRRNMGFLTGRCSGNVFVIDLDTHTHTEARDWWEALLAKHTGGEGITTVVQKTGGGGIQMLFRAPVGWLVPTNKTSIGVDIRGQGGFAMLPPCIHEKGEYQWLNPPWNTPVADAPGWLIEAVMEVVKTYGGASTTGRARGERPEASGSEYNDWGKLIDLREDKMFRMTFVVVVKWHRELNGVEPYPPDWEPKSRAEYAVYEMGVEPTVSDPSKSKTELLDMEGRGWVEWHDKFKRCMNQWHGKIAEAAGNPPPPGDEQPQPKVDPKTGEVLPLLLTAEQFLRGFVPPDYLIDGMVQRGYLYALTARTGHGKTAVAMLMFAAVGRGAVFHGHETRHGNALFLAGENSQDVRARYQVLASNDGFDAEKISCYFVDGVIDLAASMAKIKDEAAKIGDLVLIIVDTAQAYFRGDDVNNNAQQGQFAQLLRVLTRLPGSPTVIVNCHPVKNAAQDNLVPMGGSHFLNEIDGNLTLWTEEKTCVLAHHPAKWRGAPFEQLEFELRSTVSDTVRDSKGRHMPSVVAVPITEQGAERRGAVAEADEDTVLGLIHTHKTASMSEIAKKAGFVLPDGRAYKSKVQRVIERLKVSKLIFKYRGSKYKLTKKGCKVAGVKWEQDENED